MHYRLSILPYYQQHHTLRVCGTQRKKMKRSTLSCLAYASRKLSGLCITALCLACGSCSLCGACTGVRQEPYITHAIQAEASKA